MALPISAPHSPSAANSPSSSNDGSISPNSPVSPSLSVQTLALPPPPDAPSAPSSSPSSLPHSKRKPSRRANTAERRATHNAVERARRETLNSRFLDLAALLPNLSQIRRPSKSSIVNSSIAHIHASRRHRLLAARELRLLKLESDALRRELNEWRDRSGLPRVDEPVRGEAFQMILSGEVEVISPGPIEEEGADGDYDGEYADDDFPPPPGLSPHDDLGMDGPIAHHLPIAKARDLNPFAHNVPHRGGLQLQTLLPRPPTHGPHTPMIVQSPNSVSFENPAMASMYEAHAHPMHPQFSGQYLQQAIPVHDDKSGAWGPPAQMYGAQVPGGPALFTPPATSHGHGSGNVSPMNVSAPGQQQAYFMNMQHQQQVLQQRIADDGSPVSSGPISVRRERSGSINSNGSGYGSPASNPGSYEIPSVMNGGNGAAGVPRRMAGAAGWDESMNMAIGGMGMGRPISVGGGNAHAYAAMML